MFLGPLVFSLPYTLISVIPIRSPVPFIGQCITFYDLASSHIVFSLLVESQRSTQVESRRDIDAIS